ncbi:hypothetical protein Rmf_39690 [Roseomonas fluvialis]|uniref:Uncharacterized protein n=1 Tax=Roseomonas fluvialis TaxID=1750527 RepID=A0ABM7Y808_9PROT|nr:hypothetical protein Rmf_39690 [Roseomonas fluvialis]
MSIATDTSIPRTTLHAEIQLRRRGVRGQMLALLLAHGDTERDVGRGCVARSCSRFALAEAARQGVPPDDVEQLRRLVAILGTDGTVVTVMNRPTWYARFQRGHARLSARERAAMAERRSRSGARR